MIESHQISNKVSRIRNIQCFEEGNSDKEQIKQ